MNRLLRCILVSTLAMAAACAHARQQLSPSDAAAIQLEVQQTLARFQQYSAKQQWDSLAAMYADDPRFRWIENGQVRYRSPAAIRSAMSALPAGTRIETTYRDTEITAIAPDVASLATRFETRFVNSASDQSFTFGGAITMTFIRQNGAWRILEGHTSSAAARPR